jgi:tRNA:m4X modification enzyme
LLSSINYHGSGQIPYENNIDGNGACGLKSDASSLTTAVGLSRNPQSGKKVVIVAKHLCGVATDMAIRSLSAYRCIDSTTTLSPQARGLAIATCCHHACIWEDYVGQDWLRTAGGFSKAEFNVMKIWCGWAHTLRTCIERRNNAMSNAGSNSSANDDDVVDGTNTETAAEPVEHVVDTIKLNAIIRPENVSYEDMSRIGLMSKRILDQGRVNFLQQYYQFEASQHQFCSPSLSPECVVIVGRHK